jgi:oxygen-dependent protoporphyrinogen oxidase
MSVGIIGAGISGLTLAHELQKLGIDYHLWEASGQPGGYIGSRREMGSEAGRTYLLELGPNSLLGDDALLSWLDELGLTTELTFSRPVSKARYIFRNGKYRPLPSGPLSLLFGNFFSWKTKLAIWRELKNKTLSPPGETLGQFFRRRFSSEIVDYALGPFVAGIYAGDPEQLLVSETFPSLLAFEKEYGSVLRGFMKQQGGARKRSFSFREGMQTLPMALAKRLTNLSLNAPVRRINYTSSGWQVESAQGAVIVDQLVLAIGTDAAARLVADYDETFATDLRQIAYPPMTAVHSVFRRADVAHPLNGFGGLNPKVEGQFAAGHIWSSSVFDGRCADDEVLITTFVGGQQNPANARLSDEQLSQGVQQELEIGFGIQTSTPVLRTITRWERSIPQYDTHIVAIKPRIRRAEEDNLFVCSNWYGGISLSDCISKAKKLAVELSEKSMINNF